MSAGDLRERCIQVGVASYTAIRLRPVTYTSADVAASLFDVMAPLIRTQIARDLHESTDAKLIRVSDAANIARGLLGTDEPADGHDPLCPLVGLTLRYRPGQIGCECTLIARVRDDEREQWATHEAVQSSHIGMLLREAVQP